MEQKTYFQIAQQWYGQKKVIRVCFRLEIYEYDHDYVYDRTIGHLKTLACWDNYGRYSSTNNIPRWAKAFVKQVKQ